jgi:hypothetical protein
VGPRNVLNALEERKIFLLLGIEHQFHSIAQTPYQLTLLDPLSKQHAATIAPSSFPHDVTTLSRILSSGM